MSVVVVTVLFDSTLCDFFPFLDATRRVVVVVLVVVVFVVVAVTKNTCYPRVTVRWGRPLTAVTCLALSDATSPFDVAQGSRHSL